jgi:hypothetical protein
LAAKDGVAPYSNLIERASAQRRHPHFHLNCGGQMLRTASTASYAGETGPDYDELMDLIAAACSSGDEPAIAAMYFSRSRCAVSALLRPGGIARRL